MVKYGFRFPIVKKEETDVVEELTDVVEIPIIEPILIKDTDELIVEGSVISIKKKKKRKVKK